MAGVEQESGLYLSDLMQAVIEGRTSEAERVTRAAVAAGLQPELLFSEALVPAMTEVGRLMEKNEYFIPEVLVSAKAAKASTAVLRPLLTEAAQARSAGTVVIGTVHGDMHDIGKNLVAMLLEGAGFRVVDLGVDVSPEKFVDASKEHRADLVAMSALLTTTMLKMREVVKALQEAGLRDQVKVIIGGAPVQAAYATEIGADGYAPNAAAGANLARQLMRRA